MPDLRLFDERDERAVLVDLVERELLSLGTAFVPDTAPGPAFLMLFVDLPLALLEYGRIRVWYRNQGIP